MNKVILKGRLTATPELKRTVSDIFVTDFSIAVNRRFNKETTDFINCQAWRTTAEFICKYFEKGQEIAVVGELHNDKWEKDGETRYTSRISVDEVYFCGSKADNKVQTNDAEMEIPDGFEVSDDSDDLDDLPF
jgi:single-strand DNA-binding protein